ncbi:hypothetical protein PAXRUDRAFT_18083 [Paxillus rubicundulus Ve08.2h10]|uniref:Uncharacterized protein n=1 Tax=Paxillus rubicundulus Ve08.2h10 TaxID=930991 RepID=A0A0D0CMQ7_9AGAM|nr:hypothetical protein PAXRUDRAFT_18083 [Paxillus rubicundulus Ve08.2h10]
MPKRSCIPKYSKDHQDIALQEALDDWCEAKTAAVYGWSNLCDIGSCIVMPNSILKRIVDCAHQHQINNAQDLKRETGWSDAEQPLTSSIINASPSRSGPPSATMPTGASAPPNSPSVVVVSKRQIKCGACGGWAIMPAINSAPSTRHV